MEEDIRLVRKDLNLLGSVFIFSARLRPIVANCSVNDSQIYDVSQLELHYRQA